MDWLPSFGYEPTYTKLNSIVSSMTCNLLTEFETQCYGCGNSQNTIKVPRSVIPISVCSDRFPYRCLKGIIHVIQAVIFELAIILLLSLFWINRFITTITTTNISLNNRFRPTAFPSPQPHPPLNKPRHPHPFTHNRQHLHTTNIASLASLQTPPSLRQPRRDLIERHRCRQMRGFARRAGCSDQETR